MPVALCSLWMRYETADLNEPMIDPNELGFGPLGRAMVVVGATHWVAPTTPHTRPKGPKPNSLGAIIGSYKSAVSYRIHKELNATGIWQRNYYEHIIRDEKDLQNKTDYIEANPSLWDEDDNNPRNNPSA